MSPRLDELNLLLDVRQVADRLGCSTRTVRRLADSGELPAGFKMRALRRWLASDVAAYVERIAARKGVAN